MKRHRLLTLPLLASVVLSLPACSDEFDPYNEVGDFRLLAMAADNPWVAPGQSTRLTALVATSPDSSDVVSYRWSWCPLTTGSLGGYECAVTREDLQNVVDENLGPGVVIVPSFDLGTSETATLTYSLSPVLLRGLCDFLSGGEIPELVDIPDCGPRYPVSVRLDVTSGDRAIVGIKDIDLILEGEATNRNPEIRGLSVRAPTDESFSPIAPDGSTVLARDVEYSLELDLDESTAESYVDERATDGSPGGSADSTGADRAPARERLVITWFVEAGETDKTRTSFLEGEIPLDRAKSNTWRTPKAVDYPRSTLRIWVVIRDGRKGASWLVREVALED